MFLLCAGNYTEFLGLFNDALSTVQVTESKGKMSVNDESKAVKRDGRDIF
jgi:hypothetical protein